MLRLARSTWLPLLPPDKPGLYPIRFFATLDSGAKLEARGLVTVIEDRPGSMSVETEGDDIVLVEAPYGSDTYRQALRLREMVLRQPLGLTMSEAELADDEHRRHFCALASGAVIGSVSFKPLGPHTLQLKQMVVAEDRRHETVGARLLAFAEAWARRERYGLILLNARIGAEGFYARHGYALEGEIFDENTLPHIRMTKRVG